MGALHPGHVALAERSVKENDQTVVSVFVNPTQFNNPEDLTNYPRREEADFAMLRAAGCDAVFTPSADEMYPPGQDPLADAVDFGPLETEMEGRYRPGHFRGVGIVVGKLFALVKPTRSYFGEKDYQQLLVVKKLNEIRQYGVEVIGFPTVREADGVAMSSRNLRLTEVQRAAAPLIYEMLQLAQDQAGHTPLAKVLETVKARFAQSEILELEYFEIANAETLQLIGAWSEADHWVACTAAFAGPVRLIDNLRLN